VSERDVEESKALVAAGTTGGDRHWTLDWAWGRAHWQRVLGALTGNEHWRRVRVKAYETWET
jgi:hypothetical protein